MLDLSNNQLTNIPATISSFKVIQEIDLSDNQLSVLPKTINSLNFISKINLSGNRLTKLPELSNLSSLTELILDDNDFEVLPLTITKLKSLEKLSISTNKIKTLPPDFKKLEHLTTLNLSYNSFTDFEKGILPSTDLDLLDLKGNPIDDNIKQQIKENYPFVKF